MDTLNPHMMFLLILKNNEFCGSLNINELKNLKHKLELHFLASNLSAARLTFVKVSVTSYEDLVSIAKKTIFTYIGAHAFIQP